MAHDTSQPITIHPIVALYSLTSQPGLRKGPETLTSQPGLRKGPETRDLGKEPVTGVTPRPPSHVRTDACEIITFPSNECYILENRHTLSIALLLLLPPQRESIIKRNGESKRHPGHWRIQDFPEGSPTHYLTSFSKTLLHSTPRSVTARAR